MENNKKEGATNKPISLFVSDRFNHIKKINIWGDHHVSFPESESYIYLKNISHRGDAKA